MPCICTVGFADQLMTHPSACLLPLTGCLLITQDMKTCSLAFSVFALLPRQFSLAVTDIHYTDCNELPPVYHTRMQVVLSILVCT